MLYGNLIINGSNVMIIYVVGWYLCAGGLGVVLGGKMQQEMKKLKRQPRENQFRKPLQWNWDIQS